MTRSATTSRRRRSGYAPITADAATSELRLQITTAGRHVVIKSSPRRRLVGSHRYSPSANWPRLYVYASPRSAERPDLPPTGFSWIAVVRWRPRPSCLPHGDPSPWRWS
jgi:hypothetical protein